MSQYTPDRSDEFEELEQTIRKRSRRDRAIDVVTGLLTGIGTAATLGWV